MQQSGRYPRFDDGNLPGGNLPPGTYRLVETPPAGYLRQGARAVAQLVDATVVDASTIEVTVLDPAGLSLTFNRNASVEQVTVQVNGIPQDGYAGSLDLTLSQDGTPIASLLSDCIDLFHDVRPGDTYPVVALPAATGLTRNGGRIAYLFNHYGMDPDTPAEQAAALQIALWELECDATPDLTSGVFSANGVDPGVLAAAEALLAESAGKDEAAVFLDATLGGQPVSAVGRQGVLAGGSFNFSNVASAQPSPSDLTSWLAGASYYDANDDGLRGPAEVGLAGVTVTLTGALDQGGTVRATATTAGDGSYRFEHLAPGTYAIAVTTPAGIIDGTSRAGTLGGVAGAGRVSGVIVTAGAAGKHYDFGADRPPTFASTSIVEVPVGKAYDYQLAATDPDGDTLHYSILDAPVDQFAPSNRLSWTPTAADVGPHTVALRVDDHRGGSDEQDFILTIVDGVPDRPPTFTSDPVVDAFVGSPYSYQATATDPDLDPLAFSLILGPTGMPDPAPAQGLLAWTPTLDQLGTHAVTLEVADGRGGVAVQNYTVLVHPAAGNHSPHIVSTPVGELTRPSAESSVPYAYHVRAVDADDDTLTYRLLAGPPGAFVDAQSGWLGWDATDGTVEFSVRVDDGRGGFDVQSFPLTVTAVTTGEIDGRVGVAVETVQSTDAIFLAGRTDLTIPPLDVDDPDYPLVRHAYNPANAVETFPRSIPARGGESFAFEATGGVDYSQSGFVGPDGVESLVDDGGAGFTAIGPAWRVMGGGAGGTHQRAGAGDGSDTALWRLTGLPEGDYEVSATWNAAPDLSPDAVYRIYDGDAPVGTVPVDQRSGPDEGGPGFQILTTVHVASGTLRIVLPTVADGGVDADAVRVVSLMGFFGADLTGVGGISGYRGPVGGLVGVFLGDQAPSDPSPPETLDFSTGALGRTFTHLEPELGQVFFIGDGFTGTGTGLDQQFLAPAGATRLFLGIVDGFAFEGTPGEYDDNNGSFTVRVLMGSEALSGWTVFLDQDADGTRDAGEPSATTDPDGRYALTGLDPGTDTVSEVLPPGWLPFSPPSGSQTVDLGPGRRIDGVDFGNVLADPALGNHRPLINSTAPPMATYGQLYRYDVAATDADLDRLTFDLMARPAGMAIDPRLGTIAWVPTADELGLQYAVVRVRDGRGGVDVRAFTVQVVPAGTAPQRVVVDDPLHGDNHPPVITSFPTSGASLDRPFLYDGDAEDADGDPQYWDLDLAPAGMTIEPDTGVVTWAPMEDQLGPQEVIVRVSDGQGGSAALRFTIVVRGVDLPPRVDSVPPTRVAAGATYTYEVRATDPEGDPLTYTLVDPVPSWLPSPDPGQGIIQGTAPSQAGGPYDVTLRVADDHENSYIQTFSIYVVAVPPNRPPALDMAPVQSADTATPFTSQATATDPDGDAPLAYALVGGTPDWLWIDPDSGLIRSIDPATRLDPEPTPAPPPADGTYRVSVRVDDRPGAPDDAAALRSFDLIVRTAPPAAPDTEAPRVTLTFDPPGPANVGTTVTILVVASDNVGVASLDLTVNDVHYAVDAHGAARVPVPAAGTFTVVATATDAAGNPGKAQDTFSVVDPTVGVPDASFLAQALTLRATNGVDPATGLPTFTPMAIDPGATITSTLAINDPDTIQDLALHPVFSDPGNADVEVTLTRPDGAVQAQGSVNDQLAPGTYTLTIANHSATAETLEGWSLVLRKDLDRVVTAPVDILGTVGGPDLQSYTLEAAPIAGGAFTPIPIGDAPPVSDGVLGQFDPTMLADGAYTLRLTAVGAGGSTTVEQTVHVGGKLKLGNLHLSFTDLTIPVAGIPITITRSYDTLDAGRDGDFGHGWTLDEGDFQLQVGQPGGALAPAGVLAPFQDGTRVVITRPGHDPEGFTFKPQTLSGAYFAFQNFARPWFVPDPGVTSRLTVPDVELIDNGDGTYVGEDAEGTSYNPADWLFGGAYTLTTHEGLVYTFDAASGKLSTVSDRNGNTLTYDETGITSNSGRQVTFDRDLLTGHIKTITDPRGNAITYTYDAATGDLDTVTDRSGATTQFFYSDTTQHYLDHVVDPSGRIAAQVTYTGGRVSGLTDAAGGTAGMAYDLATLSEVVTPPAVDAGPNPSSTLTFDTRGNLTSTVDALGNVASAAYTGTDLTATTQAVDGRPLTTTYTYNDFGQVLTATDPLGQTTLFWYDAYGKPLSSTDPLGNTTNFDFDAHGNLLATTSPGGVTTSSTYDARGNVETVTTPDGVTTFTYYGPGDPAGAAGDVRTVTDPRDVTTTTTYDANGNLRTSDWTWVDPDDASHTRDMRTTNVYDASDRLIRTTAADGTITDTVYDVNGRVAWTDDPHTPGQAQVDGTHTIYDAAGRVIRTERYHDVVITLDTTTQPTAPTSAITPPAGDPFSLSSTVYDARGRVIWADDPHLFGQAADGTFTEYYDNGQVKGSTRYADVVIQIGTDGDDAPYSYIDPQPPAANLLSSTSTEYDAAGRVRQTTDAAGHTVTYQYDDAGHQIEVDDVVDGDARHTLSTHDGAGRLESTTDARGHTTHYDYDGDGHLIQTLFFDGTSSTATYDAHGREVTETDALGRTTRYEYNDGRGDLTDVYLPAVLNPATGSLVRPHYHYDYDPYGNLAAQTDPLNHTTTFASDAFGRKVAATLPWTPETGAPTATWHYDDLGRLDRTVDSKGQVIDYEYDEQGSDPGRVKVKHEYASQADEEADAAAKVVTYTYDDQDSGRRYDTVTIADTAAINDNGTTTTSYDVEGRVVEIDSPQGEVFYEYYPATGQKSRAYTRRRDALPTDPIITDIAYTYDPEGRLSTVTANALDGSHLGSPLVTTYTYDLNDNLVTTTFPNGTVETRTYDDLDRLWTIATTKGLGGPVIVGYDYTLDDDGRRKAVTEHGVHEGRTVTYTYDADGRLTREAIDDTVDRTIDYTYDLAGNRLTQTDTGAPAGRGTLYYLYDADDRLTTVANQPIDASTGPSADTTYLETFTYDANGSTGTDTVTTYDASGAVISTETTTDTWDLEGHLIAAVTTDGSDTLTRQVAYTYDDTGHRVSRTADGETTTYLNDPLQAYDQVLEEYSDNGVLAATYVRGLNLLFQDRGGTPSYYAKDGLGSTRALTDANGNVTDTYTYDASGNLATSTGNTPNEYLFASYQYDTATLRYHTESRDYNPATGVFDSRDSFEGDTSDPITLNHYLYVGADPVDNVDPSGHDLISTLGGLAISAQVRLLDAAPKLTVYAYAVTRVSFFTFVGSSIYLGLEEQGWVPRTGITQPIQAASGAIFFFAFEAASFLEGLPSPQGQVPYGSTSLSRQVQVVRRTDNINTARNGAAFEYRASDGSLKTIVRFSARGQIGGGHAERVIKRELESLGVQPSQVTKIYSELDFCKVPKNLSCQRMINKEFPQAVTTYSFEYGADRLSRERGLQQLKDAIAKLW